MKQPNGSVLGRLIRRLNYNKEDGKRQKANKMMERCRNRKKQIEKERIQNRKQQILCVCVYIIIKSPKANVAKSKAKIRKNETRARIFN